MRQDFTEAEILERLEMSLRRMPERRQMIFLAVRLDGESYAKLAERTGLSVRKIECEVAAALVQLDRALHNRHPARWWRRWFG
jgi:RNA polymerase sigma-70 factor (ECF subfamily)